MELELLTDVIMTLHYEIGIREEITRAIFHYAEANNKYTYSYDKTRKFMNFIS